MTFSLPICRTRDPERFDDLDTLPHEVSDWIDLDPARTQAALETLRAWTKRLAAPGAWWPEAPEVVGPALVSLADWKEDALRVDTAAGKALYEKDAGRWWRPAPRSIVMVCQEGQQCHWRPGGPQSDRPGRQHGHRGDQGDSFFLAVLRALPEHGAALAGVHGCPIALRQRVVGRLEEVLGQWEASPGQPLWLRGVLRELPSRQEGVTSEVRASRHAIDGSGGAGGPNLTRSQPKRGAQQRIQQAWACVRAGDFRDACLQVEGVYPRALVPLRLLRALCAKPFETDDAGLLKRMVSMMERLAEPPHDLFLPAIGLSPDGLELDLHHQHIFVNFPPGHPNEWKEGEAVSSGMARVLFQLHLQRGTLSVKTKFVVGEHGTNALQKAIDASITAQGWETRLALWPSSRMAKQGVLAIWTGDDGAKASDLVHRPPLASRLGELEQRLVALANDSESARHFERTSWVIRSFHQIDEVRSVLKQLAYHGQLPPPLPLRLHEQLAMHCASRSAWEAVEEILPVLKVLHGGALPKEFWRLLIQSAGEIGVAWQAARTMYELRCREEAHPPSDEELEGLFSRIVRCPDLEEAAALYRSLCAGGMPASARVINMLLRKSSWLGVTRHVANFQKALRLLGVSGGVEAQRSALIFTCLRHPDRLPAELHALRQRGVSLDRDAMRSVVRACMVRDDVGAAAAEIRRSITLGEDVYRPALGLLPRQDDGPVRIEVGRTSIYATVDSVFDYRQVCTMYEALAILQLHFQEGRLTHGCELCMAQETNAANAKRLRDFLATLRLALEPVRSAAGIQTRFWRVVALDRGPT